MLHRIAFQIIAVESVRKNQRCKNHLKLEHSMRLERTSAFKLHYIVYFKIQGASKFLL